jgi:hypothetical protein
VKTYCARLSRFGKWLFCLFNFLAILALIALTAPASAAELKFNNIKKSDMSAVAAGSTKRALFKNAGTVGSQKVDLVAKASTGTSANDFAVHIEVGRPGISSIYKGKAEIWADWYIYQAGIPALSI